MSNDYFKVKYGQLTFDAEGTEGGTYHSRTPHVPTDSSGVTIGRGYDLKERKSNAVVKDLTNAGITKANAQEYAKGVGLSGNKAREFIKKAGNKLVEITPKQQKSLFVATYKEMEKDVIRICNKPDVVKKYGRANWPKVKKVIREVVIDLRYRGDYHGASRTFLQKHIVNNDLAAFKKEMVKKSNWSSVPDDRFKRRKKYLENA